VAPGVRDITDDVRVLICSMPDLQSDVIDRVVGGQPDMSIVLRDVEPTDLEGQIACTRPDVVIASTAHLVEPSALLVALAAFPDVRLLLLGTGAESPLVPAQVSVPAEGEWAVALVDLIRASVHG
jgi:hypothetical protein